MRVMEQSARRNRYLGATVPAPAETSLHLPSPGFLTVWTNESVRPTQHRNIIPTRLLRSELVTKLHDRLWIVLHRAEFRPRTTRVNCIALIQNSNQQCSKPAWPPGFGRLRF